MDLSLKTPKAQLNFWSAHQVHGRAEDTSGLIGMQLVAGDFKTTEVMAVDGNRARILTRSGSCYQLGTPNLMFALKHPNLIKEAGI